MAGQRGFIALVTWGLLLAAVIVAFSVSRERRRLGVCVLLMLGLYAVIGGRGFVDVAYATRTFFGTYRVVSDPQHKSFTLFHGTTIHGRQDIGSGEPLTYYHRKSPIAEIFASRPAGPSDQSAPSVSARARWPPTCSPDQQLAVLRD